MKQIYLIITAFACCNLGLLAQNSPYVSKVLEYKPAPGQFINTTTWGSPAAAQSLTGGINGHVSLGAYGGYVIVGFDHSIENDPANPYGVDFTVFGNAFKGWSEPGIVSVMKDDNQNGVADDTWYELKGSDYELASTEAAYAIMYANPRDYADVPWRDIHNSIGVVKINAYHTQPYYPSSALFPAINQGYERYSGTLIAGKVDDSNPTYIQSYALDYGYADNHPKKSGDPVTQPDNPATIGIIEGAGGDAGHLLFNCNDFTGGSFLALWNGNTGNAHNFEKMAVYGGSSYAWFGMLKATGDITAEGKAYMLNMGSPLAEIRLSNGPSINRPINDLLLPVNAPQTIINLADYFTAKESTTVEYSVSTATNSILSSSIIEGTNLKIDYLRNESGSAEVTVTGTAAGDATNITFSIELREIDYSNGAFIVNEDWFGHYNGSVNYLTSDKKFVYRAYQQENAGKTLGVTTQYGTIYGDRFFLMSKQGPRLVVTDATSMKEQTHIEEFVVNEEGNKSDGRAFVGVTPEKGYISTSKGIYLYDIPTMTVGSQLEGTSGEVGNMLRAGKYVFAVKSSEVYIIDATTDQIIQTISGASYSDVVQAYDGDVYIGAGSKLMKFNPYTLIQEEIALPDGISLPSSFGFAWNAGSFCASATENSLFWAKPGGWSGSKTIYKYIIGDETSLNNSFITMEDGMELYGAGLRVHPATNQLYVTGKKSGWGNNSLTNTLYVFDGTSGIEVSRHELEPYYWFPALPVFPDAHGPVFKLNEVDFRSGDGVQSFTITDLVSDADNNDASILVSVSANTDNRLVDAEIIDNQLVLTPQNEASGTATITLQAISNGKVSEASLRANISQATTMNDLKQARDITIYPLPFQSNFTIKGDQINGGYYQLVTVTGQIVKSGLILSDEYAIPADQLASGTYILIIKTTSGTSTHKLIK